MRAYGIILPDVAQSVLGGGARLQPHMAWTKKAGCAARVAVKIEATGRRIWPNYLYYVSMGTVRVP